MGSSSDLISSLGKALIESLTMIGIAIGVSIIIGGVLGLFLYLTSNELFYKNKLLNSVAGFIVNVIRSVPFVIMLILVMPFTMFIVGSTIGPLAASVSLTITSIAFFARIVEGALSEVNKGVIEAAIASGAKLNLIIINLLLIEALPSLIRGITVTLISLIGYSAMAGIVGGGGVGDLAIRFGYYRYDTKVMIVTVVILVVIVQIIQYLGDKLAVRMNKN